MGELFDRAIRFAVEKHAGQCRKGSQTPYIVHPLEAAAVVATVTADDALLAAAVLHDTLEDTSATAAEIREAFGERVAALVGDESEDKRPGQDPRATWMIRKQEALARLRSAGSDARLIALGDKLSNIRAISRDHALLGDRLWQRFHQQDPALHGWYYRALAGIFEADPRLAPTAACAEYRRLVRRVFPDAAEDA